jgi:hypothetical protein
MTPSRRMINPLLQRALRVRIRFRTAPELHLLTYIIPPLLTPIARLARQPYFQRNLITYFEPCDVRPDAYDHAGRFMPKGHGLAHEDVAVAEVAVVGRVRDSWMGVRGMVGGEGGWRRTIRRSCAPWRTEARICRVPCATSGSVVVDIAVSSTAVLAQSSKGI